MTRINNSRRFAMERILAILLASMGMCRAATSCPDAPALTGGTSYAHDAEGPSPTGAYYLLYNLTANTGTMTVYGKDAAFKGTWNGSGEHWIGMGLAWSGTLPTYDQFASIEADYAYRKSGTVDGWGVVGIYGITRQSYGDWTRWEFYIVDDWFGTSPPRMLTKPADTLAMDSGTYDIYHETSRSGAADGITFERYYSIRRTPRNCGHIAISEHFAKWKDLGMPIKGLSELLLMAQATGGRGSIDYTSGSVVARRQATSTTPPGLARPGSPSTRFGTTSIATPDGRVVREVRWDDNSPDHPPTSGLPRGLYIVRQLPEGATPATGKLLVP